jgi:hypothetical protein
MTACNRRRLPTVLTQGTISIDDLLLPYSVDLVIYGQIRDPDLRAHIQHAGVVFYQRAEAAPTR